MWQYFTSGSHPRSRRALTFLASLAALGCSDPPPPVDGGNLDGGVAVVCEEEDLFAPAACPMTLPAGCVVYVDGARESSGDGASWGGAVRTPQEGIDLARCGVLQGGACTAWQVWVRAGTYHVHRGCRTDTVRLRAGVALHGGFAGTEASLDERDLGLHETILDGRAADDPDARVYHVVLGADDATLDGVTVRHGRADHPSEPRHQQGGGMLNEDVAPRIRNARFVDNYASGPGGGVRNLQTRPLTMVVSDSVFLGNVGRDGGGISTERPRTVAPDAPPSLRLERCAFEQNRALDVGGGVHGLRAAPVVYDSLFRGNDAGDGGGIATLRSRGALLERVRLEGNFAQLRGGGLYVFDGQADLLDCEIVENRTLSYGGAGVCFFEGAQGSVRGSSFLRNRGYQAAGLWISGSDVQVERTRFEDNRAVYNGGGIAAQGGRARIESTLLIGNDGGQFGGGLVAGFDAPVTLVNTVVAHNRAGQASAIGLAYGAAPVSLVHCTVAGNVAPPGAWAIDTTLPLTIAGSILHDPGSSGEIRPRAGLVTVRHTLVRGGHEGAGNVDAEPLFADLERVDLELAEGSPCIDAADVAEAPERDLLGRPRVGPPDMGAYERQEP